MPNVIDYSENEDENDGGIPAATGSSPMPAGGSGVRPQAAQKQPEANTFVPWERFVSANKSVSDRNAQKLQADTQRQVNAATGARQAAGKAFGQAVEANYEHQAPSTEGTKPWGSFTTPAATRGSAAQRGVVPSTAPMPSNLAALQAKSGPQAVFGETEDPNSPFRTGLTAAATQNGPQGPKSVEDMLGEKAWGSLLGQTKAAEDQARSLGSEGGVQSLIQRGAVGPSTNSAFDAALTSGAGGAGFRQTAKANAGLTNKLGANNAASQNAWQRLSGDVSNAQNDKRITDAAARGNEQIDAANKANAAAAAKAAADQAAANKPPEPWRPEGYTDWKSFIDPNINDANKAGQYAHEAAMYASPVDWLTRGLGELGYNGENASQLYAGAMGGGAANGNGNGTWQQGNLRSAARLVQDEYGPEAMQYWWEHMTPQMWQGYMDLGNAGAMARDMRAWLESAGFKKGEKGPAPNPNQGGSSNSGVGGGNKPKSKD